MPNLVWDLNVDDFYKEAALLTSLTYFLEKEKCQTGMNE